MRLGVAVGSKDPWRFFDAILDDLQSHYEADTFKFQSLKTPFLHERINRVRFHRALDRFLSEHDVVFFEWASDLLAAATRLPKRGRIVTRLHRYELFQWAPHVNWDAVDAVILVSQAMRRRFVERFPSQAGKTVVLPVGVSTERYKPTAKPFAGDIGTLGSLAPRKRVYDLILAFRKLVGRRERLHLHIGGGFEPEHLDYFEALQWLVKESGLQDRVTFYGEVRSPWEWYGRVDVFISNSYSEGLQVAPMEAMACGCQTYSHCWDGAEELVPEENLFLDGDELGERLLAYYDLPEADKRLCRERMRSIACEKFDVEKTKKGIRAVIKDVMDAAV